MNLLPTELNGLIRQYAGVRPSTRIAFQGVLKQMRRKHAFKRTRRRLEANVARWVDPRGFYLGNGVWGTYVYLDWEERQALAHAQFEMIIEEIQNDVLHI
jgi:hypothetical protein